jgi:hypothetical protein
MFIIRWRHIVFVPLDQYHIAETHDFSFSVKKESAQGAQTPQLIGTEKWCKPRRKTKMMLLCIGHGAEHRLPQAYEDQYYSFFIL